LHPGYKKELVHLALNSLESRDVPVASLLIYRDKVIGKGYNTVVKNAKAGEHAEINAISKAIDSLGFQRFQTLDRDSLWLLSTYEPCMMCAGAIVIYNSQHVCFLKEKSFNHNLRHDARLMRYFLKRKTLGSNSLQDSLFYLHPDYPK
jgi:tRNA(Arg) A34 adenosine deaminase TadA